MNERATPAETVDATRRTPPCQRADRARVVAHWTHRLGRRPGRRPGHSELDHNSAQWPYDIAGICFALYGLAVIGYGSLRRGAMDARWPRAFPEPPRHAHAALALSGVALALLTILIIVIS